LLDPFYIKINKKIILASQSLQRLSLLNSIGINPCNVVSPSIDETIYKNESPRDYVLRVAILKGKKFKKKFPDNIIIAADTVVVCGASILDKTEDKIKAKNSLFLLSGRWHKVYSCVVLFKQNRFYHKIVMTKVRFKRLSNSDIDYYIESKEWLGKAGSYAIQGKASAFIIEIKGSYTNVIGLPLYETVSLINGVGV